MEHEVKRRIVVVHKRRNPLFTILKLYYVSVRRLSFSGWGLPKSAHTLTVLNSEGFIYLREPCCCWMEQCSRHGLGASFWLGLLYMS